MDYHAILGLDPGASLESIKVAYRRLARENHPDLFGRADAEILARASQRMAEINEAYTALAQPATREGNARREPAPSASANGERFVPTPAGRLNHRADTSAVSSSLFGELSQQLRSKLTAPGTMHWHDSRWEGFELSLTAGSWHSRYAVALRGFTVADLIAVSKFTNYAELAIHRSRTRLRRSFFLFVLPFQRISHLEEVAMNCRRLCLAHRPAAAVAIGLVDVAHARSLLCGEKTQDERFSQILKNSGFASA